MEELVKYENELKDIQSLIGDRSLDVIGINELANLYGSLTETIGDLKGYLVETAKDVDNLGLDTVEMVLTSGKRILDRISDMSDHLAN